MNRRLICTAIAVATLLRAGHAASLPEGWKPDLHPVLKKNIEKATLYYFAGEYDKANLLLDELEKKTRPSNETMTIRGAIATRKKDFEKAREWFQRCIDADPKNVDAKFNMAEIEILCGNYRLARTLLSEIPVEPATAEKQQFYIIVSYVLEGNLTEAKRLVEQMKFPCDTAAYYFACASVPFKEGDTEEGNKLLNAARKIFGRKVDIGLMDLFAQVGWIKMEIPSPDQIKAASAPEPAIPQIVPTPKPEE
jgi:tetratricopeptide (TPR) repeat protein